jgi:hypothetical protein
LHFIAPPYAHVSTEESVRAGCPLIITVVEPGIHGIGVRTPIAEAVADATVGFERLIHIPKGFIFTNGLLSIIVAIGFELTLTILCGITVKGIGAFPKEHWSIALLHTQNPIYIPAFCT